MAYKKSVLTQQSEEITKKTFREMVLTDIDYIMNCNVVDLKRLYICTERKKGKSLGSIAQSMKTSRQNILEQSKSCA